MSVTLTNVIDGAIAGVETALANIKRSNDYNFDLGNTDFWASKSIDEVSGGSPHVYIVGYEGDNDRFTSSRLRLPLTVSIRGITPSGMQGTARSNVSKLHADIHAAMFVDEKLGGSVSRVFAAGVSVEASGTRETMHSVIDLDFILDLHYVEATP